MFRPFLDSLRRQGVPVSLREYLDLLAQLTARTVAPMASHADVVARHCAEDARAVAA